MSHLGGSKISFYQIMKQNIKKYLPSLLFFSFIIWMISQADLDQSNVIMDMGHAVPWGDKIGHFSLFGIMALLLNVALHFRRINIKKRLFHLGSVIVFAFAVVEEFTQLAFSTRTFDLLDMLFDLLGIGILSSVAFRRFVVKKLDQFASYLTKRFCLD